MPLSRHRFFGNLSFLNIQDITLFDIIRARLALPYLSRACRHPDDRRRPRCARGAPAACGGLSRSQGTRSPATHGATSQDAAAAAAAGAGSQGGSGSVTMLAQGPTK
jgi:hypothetical protein